jgi:hypothetical protein
LAFIDILTTIWSTYEAFAAFAVTIVASFSVPAIAIDIATWSTKLVRANFALEAIFVRVT